MKILFDHQLFSRQRYGGASKYFVMLLQHLDRELWDTTTILSNNAYLEALDLFPVRHWFYNHDFRGRGRIMSELNKPYTVCRLAKKNYDIYHQTHFDPFGLRWIGNKPMVTTFHDINFSTINPMPTVEQWQRVSLARADKIIAVSECTKRDMLEIFKVDPQKVEVIYHGIEPAVDSGRPRLVENPYILYVGTRVIHKNFNRLAEAFSAISPRYPELRLVCTSKAFNATEQEMFKRLGIEDKVINISANEEEMNRLYRDALLFCFPSLYEGFGMPILEAMINHCPALISNASCFPEIASDAALYFEAEQTDDLKDKLEQMINDEELRSSLIRKGNQRVKLFSWDKCAREHLEVYKSLM